MPKRIHIKDVGIMNFPDSASEEDIAKALAEIRQGGGSSLPIQSEPVSAEAPGLLGGFAETALPSTKIEDYWEGGAYLMQHPIESAKIVANSILNAHKEQFAKAGEEWEQGRYAAATSRAIGGALPFYGPSAAEAAHRIAEGEVSRGIGNILGLIVPNILHGTAKTLNPARIKATGPTISGVTIPLTRGRRLNKPAWKITEGIIQKTIPGAGPFNKYMELEQRHLLAAADNTADLISTFKGNPEQLGRVVEPAIKAAKKTLHGAAKQIYAKIDAEVAPLGISPSTQSLKKIAGPLLNRITRQGDLIPPADLAPITAQLETIMNAPDTLPFAVFQDSRSTLRAIARKYDDLIPGKRAALSKRLAKRTSSAMETALIKAKRPDLLEKLRAADAMWHDLHETFNGRVVKRLVKSSPEAAHKVLLSPAIGLDDIRLVKRVVGKDIFDGMARQNIRDILDDSIKGEAMPSVVPPGLQASVSVNAPIPKTIPTLKGAAFMNKLEQLKGNGKLDELVSPDIAKALLEIANVAKVIEMPTGQLVSNIINATLIGKTAWDFARGGFPAIIEEMATSAGLYTVAKLMTMPQGATAIRAFVRAMASKNIRTTQLIGTRVGRMVEEQQRKDEAEQRAIATVNRFTAEVAQEQQ